MDPQTLRICKGIQRGNIEIDGYNYCVKRGGKLHCETGPAQITYYKAGEGTYKGYGDVVLYQYFSEGIIHRADGPAVIYMGANVIIRVAYWVNGIRHRADGAAVIQRSPDGSYSSEWWLDGNKYTKEEFDKHTNVPRIIPAAEIPDSVDMRANIDGTVTFSKLTAIVFDKYLMLSTDDPDNETATALLAFYIKIRATAQQICDSGFVSIDAHDFKTIYNIYIAKLAAAVPINSAITPAVNSAIKRRKKILAQYHEFCAYTRGNFFASE